MNRNKLLFFGIAAFLFSACSDNAQKTANEGTASAVSNAVGVSLGEVGSQLNFPRTSPYALTGQGSFDFSGLVLNCPNGGTVTVSGNIQNTVNTDVTPNVVNLTDTLSDQLTGCGVKAMNGLNYTVDGTLAVEGSGTIQSPDLFAGPRTIDANFNSHITGTASVKDDQGTVTDCPVDLQVSTTVSGTSPRFTGSHDWNGTVCGNATSGTLSIGRDPSGGQGGSGGGDDDDDDDPDEDHDHDDD